MGGGGHWRRSSEELLRALASHEERIRREYAASLELIAELGNRDVAVEVGYPSLAGLVRDVLRISPSEARRRIGHAAVVTEVPVVSGGVVPAALPVTAAALREGVLGADHVDVIAKTLSDLPLYVADADREVAERTLVEAAHSMDARTLTKVGHRVRAWLDQDGTPPEDRDLAEPVNELHLHTRRNGRLALRGEFDREASALLTTVLSPLATPRPSNDTGPDPRTAAERQGDALVEVFQLAADTGGLPSEAGEKPHVLVTVPLDTLRTGIVPQVGPVIGPDQDGFGCDNHIDPRADEGVGRGRFGRRHGIDHQGDHCADEGVARGSSGRPDSADHPLVNSAGQAVLDGVGMIDAASARRIACDAKVIPAVLGSRSEPLDLGRASYTIPTALRRALVLRDGGCAFPGCDRSHRWCHGHHIRHWANGGPTQLDNLVLLCGTHHRLIHHSDWDCAIRNGRAEFRPPAFVDRTRKPRRNVLHAAVG